MSKTEISLLKWSNLKNLAVLSWKGFKLNAINVKHTSIKSIYIDALAVELKYVSYVSLKVLNYNQKIEENSLISSSVLSARSYATVLDVLANKGLTKVYWIHQCLEWKIHRKDLLLSKINKTKKTINNFVLPAWLKAGKILG